MLQSLLTGVTQVKKGKNKEEMMNNESQRKLYEQTDERDYKDLFQDVYDVLINPIGYTIKEGDMGIFIAKSDEDARNYKQKMKDDEYKQNQDEYTLSTRYLRRSDLLNYRKGGRKKNTKVKKILFLYFFIKYQ